MKTLKKIIFITLFSALPLLAQPGFEDDEEQTEIPIDEFVPSLVLLGLGYKLFIAYKDKNKTT